MRRKTILLSTAKLKCMKNAFFDWVTKMHKKFCLFGVKMPIFYLSTFRNREIKMPWNTLFLLDHEIKMLRNAIYGKKNREIFMPRHFHAIKYMESEDQQLSLNIW